MIYVIKKKEKNQESIQSSTKPDPGQHMGSDFYTRKHHIQEYHSQIV